MRHRRKGSRLGRKSNQLKALLRSLVTSLILNEKMVTTQSKAKALVPLFDRLVVKVRKNSKMNAIRELKKVLFGEESQRKFMNEIVPRLEGRPSGFTKSIKIGFRNGDNAPVVRIEILSGLEEKLKTSKTLEKTEKVEEYEEVEENTEKTE